MTSPVPQILPGHVALRVAYSRELASLAIRGDGATAGIPASAVLRHDDYHWKLVLVAPDLEYERVQGPIGCKRQGPDGFTRMCRNPCHDQR